MKSGRRTLLDLGMVLLYSEFYSSSRGAATRFWVAKTGGSQGGKTLVRRVLNKQDEGRKPKNFTALFVPANLHITELQQAQKFL